MTDYIDMILNYQEEMYYKYSLNKISEYRYEQLEEKLEEWFANYSYIQNKEEK
ncbi:hypothetical protein [Oceanobacillus kimchii]|uniref:Uncharacterized protein n=1 Tax=Oceanobacillus kimchii TaxID=746691 RepID=A0ABQ5TMC1_9BACI|nr:hypothetical protein [Oceanobacillus kimchii]GLO66265.1 hypothetical protein MACH08_20490 [Oceanobacillus kimchii]